MMHTLNETRDYMYCSLLYYLKYKKKIASLQKNPMSSIHLPGKAISQALQVYATGNYPDMTFREMTKAIWATWMKQKGIEKNTLIVLLAYEAHRNKIMEDYLSGKVKKPQGKRYVEPRLAHKFKEQIGNAGLIKTANDLENELLDPIGVTPAELEKLGRYKIADAFADSMIMADVYQLPSPQAIICTNSNLHITTGNGITIEIEIEMLILGETGTIAVLHDKNPVFFIDKAWVGRNLEVIAASMYQGDGDGVKPVNKVLVKHLMTGEVMSRKQVRNSRLSLSLLHAIRGIEADLYIPQFLSGDLGRCKKCPAAFICLNTIEDPIEATFPGTLSWSDRVVAAAEKIDGVGGAEIMELARILADTKITPHDLIRFEGKNNNE